MSPRDVIQIASGRMQREGGGFMVRRVLGGQVKSCDPLLMMDHLGPVDYGPGEALGAPDHPHRGFETVTYVIDGGMQHKDSAGNSGVLGPGWVQWMTAGSGVIHSEMPTDEIMKNGGRFEGFQLWVNLPAKDKMTKPRYQDTPPEKIPDVYTSDKKVKVKIIAGHALGTNAYIETRSPMLYLDIHLQPGGSFTQDVPQNFDGFAYVWRGQGTISGKEVKFGQTALLGKGSGVTLSATSEECRVLLIAGEPLREPVVWHGPFVMNTQQQIDQAFQDYHAGRLGHIKGKEERMKQTEAARKKQDINF